MPETWDEVDALQSWCDHCGATFLIAPPIIPNKAIVITCKDHFRVKCPYCRGFNLKGKYDFNMINRQDAEDLNETIFWG